MEWTREQRYRTFDTMTTAEQNTLLSSVSTSFWRQGFHIQPPYGLLNDPNGFTWFNGRFYLFYQWFPFGPVHGLKNWYQTSSAQLTNWESDGIALKPEYDHESHGIFSGSGLVYGDKLYLFYTANHRNDEWERKSSQCVAIMETDGTITKVKKPIIAKQPPGYTEHFRDPKVWQAGNRFYMVIGAQRDDMSGCILFYDSENLFDWKLIGELQTNEDQFGFMWECPDYFELDGRGILLFSPQGLQSQGESYQNLYQAGTFVGDRLDLKSGKLTHAPFQEIDAGFDFYAPQTTAAPDGRRLLIGWMGLPEIAYPTDQEGWAHCMTIPRELFLQNGSLCQRPARELKELRGPAVTEKHQVSSTHTLLSSFSAKRYELAATITLSSAKKAGLALCVGEQEQTLLYMDRMLNRVVLDRTNSGVSFAEEYGTTRSVPYSKDHIKLQIFVDSSSIEVFVNNGEATFTARIFPQEGSTGISFFSEDGSSSIKAIQWEY
ncbi:beta-fructofuranosidase [Alkalihalobacillus xiaoxiensis]|uniref:Sucrose-6-phosphate hydrolase n=1 Tax=Shouchella xiaoxiensis TaxID=766895 RepID=A0ABS2SVI7_9BACI|nr:sucrose-6-phosphate hydrolase [Shouchella xiaoxiensis]MBM7839255.1 beta-fructofuranosidase [Shouchella xiaoxiensis]